MSVLDSSINMYAPHGERGAERLEAVKRSSIGPISKHSDLFGTIHITVTHVQRSFFYVVQVSIG